jgi:hypothetical protein
MPTSTKSYLRNRRQEKRKIQIDVNIGAPQIVIPLSSQGTLIVDLGSVILTNDIRDKNDAVTLVQENDEEEYLTPESSLLVNDGPLEEEMTYYSINTIPTDIEYASFSLSVRDIQVGYSVDLSQIVEKFSIHFLVQHRLDHLWPLINISSTIQNMVLHLNPQVIQILYDSIHPWIALIDISITKHHYQSDVWPVLNFRLDEISVQLNDESQALCDIRMQNIDLSLTNNHRVKNLVFTLQTLTIFDGMQHDGEKYDFLLKTNQISTNLNDNFIRIHTDFSTTPVSHESNLNVDVNADKLDFAFNPKTICALVNSLLNIKLLSWSENKKTNSISCRINTTFRELNIFVTEITSMLLSTELHLQNISLNTSLNPFSILEMTMTSIQILDLLSYPQQSTTALIIDHEVSRSAALHLSLKNTENNTHNLSLKIASVSYIHSLKIIDTVQQTLDYMTQNCHLINNQATNTKNYITSSTLSIDLRTLKITFPVDITLQLGQIRIRNDAIDIDRIEMKSNHISLSQHTTYWPLLENISIVFNLQMSDASIKINSELISPLRIYLSQHRIKLLQQLLQTPFVRHTSSLSSTKFVFHLHSIEMVVILQTDRNDELVTVCEAVLNQCQMIYESESTQIKRIALQLASLHMKEHRMNSDESLIALTSVHLTDNQHERIDIKLGKIAIRFTKSTWKILSEIIDIIDSSGIQEKKNHPKEILVNIDSIACLFQDDRTLLMNIDLQRFNVSVRSSIIHGQLSFISIRDLTTIDQLYSERLYTTGTNVIVFTLTIEEDHNANHFVCSQFQLQLKSIQYIHTQSFLVSLIDYFNRLRSFLVKPVISQINQRFYGILLNIELENTIFILPEHLLKKPVLIFQLGSIHFSTSPLNFITIKMKDINFYSSSHSAIDGRSSLPIHFSKFGFNRTDTEPSSMVRQPFHLNIEIERNLDRSTNQTSPKSIIKINLSSLDILFDINHYHLIENILTYNLNDLWKFLIGQKDVVYTDFACIIEIDHVGLEVFMLEMDLLSFNHRRSVGYAALTNLHLSFDQYINGNQVLHLLCSTMKLVDTRIQHEDMILPLSMPSDGNQLEIYLLRTKLDNKCTITMNYMRFLVVIDWLIALNEFLNLFCNQPSINKINISIGSVEIKLNLNRFDLILVSTTKDPYSSAIVYSSTMTMNYKQTARPLECIFNDFTFLTCQIGNIDETAISIIEPTDCSLNIQPSNELLDEQICELTIPLLNIRLSYSDIHMIYSLIHTISKQISQAKTRKPLLTLISSVLTSPLRTLQSWATRFLNMKFLKFISDQICLCLIDDCFGVNIPLLNIHLKPFILQTIENSHSIRTDQCEFDLNISYYNRFQSGFEPLIELCPLQMTFNRSSSSILLFISSKEILNLNFTKAMYRLIGIVKTNWLADYQKTKKEVSYRRVKPSDPYCFKNLLGIRVKFRTWIIAEQRFSSSENIVDDNQTTSFCFPTHSSPVRQRLNSLVASLFQSDRRILISIDGWEPLQPISIDRVGTFFRLAKPSNHQQLYKSILVIIDIAMTNSSIRLITIRSSIEIRNQLLTSIELRWTSQFNFTHEFCLEPNETRSLPIQLCSGLEAIYLRPANFALDYCDDPINWSEIEKNSPLVENTKTRQSFLRTCSIDGKEAVYYVCLQSKQTCLLTYSNQSFSIHQLIILPPLTICNLLPCTLTFEISSYSQKFELNAYKIHREHTVNIRQNLDFLFATNLYRMTKPLHLPMINDLYRMKHMHERVIFYDCTQRELMVDIRIECAIEYRLKIVVSVPYVLLNRSGKFDNDDLTRS